MTSNFPNKTAGILCDIGGVLLVEEQPIDGAVEAVAAIRNSGLPCRFLTNTTTVSLDTLQRKLNSLGFDIPPEQIITPTRMAARYLRQKGNPRCLFLVEDDTRLEFEGLAVDENHPDVIVVGHYGNRWNYDLLNRLFKLMLGGAELVALHKGRFWQTDEGLTLDFGAVVAGLEYATGKEAIIIGKPSENYFHLALAELKLAAAEVAIIGDDINSDIGAAQKLGITGILVKTGKYREEFVSQSKVTPDLVIDSIASLPELLSGGSH